jgi:hypothetical protein
MISNAAGGNASRVNARMHEPRTKGGVPVVASSGPNDLRKEHGSYSVDRRWLA